MSITGYTDNFTQKELEYRMYCLVLRQLSPINKGIQMAHSCLEYAQKFHNESDYQQYITKDKTLIMLDAGTSLDMDFIIKELEKSDINYAIFCEPDLYGMPTAICFLADERVWDKEKYTQSETEFLLTQNWPIETFWNEYVGGEKNAKLIQILEGKRLSM